MITKTLIALILVGVIHSQYNQELGYNLAQLAITSYCNPQKIQDWSCGPCRNSAIKLDNIQSFRNSSGSVVGYVGTSSFPSAMYVVFKGADPWNLNKWYEGIDNVKVNYPLCNNGCQVHREFYREYSDFSKNVINTIKEYANIFQKSRTTIVGHGLGGSFAVFAAAQLVSEGVNVNDVYTYGMPRSGDVRFTSWWDGYVKGSSKIRVTHNRDGVPHLAQGIVGFVHVTHEIFYKGSMSEGFVSCNDLPTREDLGCSDHNLNNRTLTDHLNYYDIDWSNTIMGCQ